MNRKPLLAVLALATLFLTGCVTKTVYTHLNEHEAQEMLVLLNSYGIPALREKELGAKEGEGGWEIKVRGGQDSLAQALRILQEHGFPRAKVKGMEEVYSQTGLIPTAGEEKARMLMALTGDISRTLRSVEGIADARVHVVIPDNSPLVDKSQWAPVTASVLIKHRGKTPALAQSEVQALVAKSVAGLQPENVAVVAKKMPEAIPPGSVQMLWYLNNDYLLVGAFLLLLFSVLNGARLTARVRTQRRMIEDLQRQLKEKFAVPA